MSKGLYDSMQDLNASAFWMFAAMNAGVVLIRVSRTSVNSSVIIAVISSNTLTALFGVRHSRRI
jgi:hypothetical protein